MKKSIHIVLTCVNITVIALLLVGSACILSLNNTNIIKGHYFVVFTDSGEKDVFVVVDGYSKIKQSDRVLYRQYTASEKGTLTISRVISVEGKTITIENGITLPTSSRQFIGKVAFKNYFLGRVFNFTMNNQTLTWVLVGGGFITLSLGNIFMFMVMNKKSFIDGTIQEEESELLEIEMVQEDINAPVFAIPIIPATSIISKPITIDEEFELEIRAITHDFESVEELYNHYNTKEIEEEINPPPIIEEILAENTSYFDIDRLLEEIMNKAKDDFFAEQAEYAQQAEQKK